MSAIAEQRVTSLIRGAFEPLTAVALVLAVRTLHLPVADVLERDALLFSTVFRPWNQAGGARVRLAA